MYHESRCPDNSILPFVTFIGIPREAAQGILSFRKGPTALASFRTYVHKPDLKPMAEGCKPSVAGNRQKQPLKS